MTTPLSAPPPQPTDTSIAPPPSDSKPTPSVAAGLSAQPVAGPSRPTQQRPSLPTLSLPPNAITNPQTLQHQETHQTHQARLAMAQQAAMQSAQQANMGDASKSMTNGSNGNGGSQQSDQLLKQLRALQASNQMRQQAGPSVANGGIAAPPPANGNMQLPASTASPSAANQAPSPVNGSTPSRAAAGPTHVSGLPARPPQPIRPPQQPSTPSTPTHPPGSAAARPPMPNQVKNQRAQFLQSLASHYKSHNMPLPPEVFNGERDGSVKVGSAWVDLLELFMAIMRAQGVLNALKQPPEHPTWAGIMAKGIPNPLPEPLTMPRSPHYTADTPDTKTTNPIQYLVGIYMAYIKSFEEDMTKRKQAGMQKQQAAAVGRPPASPAQAQPSTPNQPTSVATPMAPKAQPAVTSSPQVAQTPVPTAATTTAPNSSTVTPAANGQSSATLVPSSAMSLKTMAASSPASMQQNLPPPFKLNKHTGGATSIPTPIDTSLASDGSIKAEDDSATTPLDKKRKRAGVQSSEQTPQRPSSPKRARYKVQYKPIHIPMTGLAGWDERAVRSTFPKNNLAHASHSIHDLGVVDMEAVLMGIRSRLPRELGYAITALSMLSMPHPEDNLDGLPLLHLMEIFSELLTLLEEAAFGEDGYEAWEKKMSSRPQQQEFDIAKLDFEQFEQVGRHVDISLPIDPEGDDRWRKDKTGGSTDIILSVVNLLRNFSLYDDNRLIMARHPMFLPTLARVIDTRLVRVPGWCTSEEPYSYIEYATISRDVVVILTNVGRFMQLGSVPFSCVESIFGLLSRTLSTGLEIQNFKDSPYDKPSVNRQVSLPVILTIYRAAEAFYNLAGSDTNREVLGRLRELDLVKMFDSLVKLLPMTTRQYSAIISQEMHLIYSECMALCLYSLAFLSSLSARTSMRDLPGATAIIRRIILSMMPRSPDFPRNPYSVICRRLAETLGVLNGTVTCTGEGSLGNMGFSAAAAGDGKGWRWTSGVVESGWLAEEHETITQCLMIPGVDQHTFAELDALWWANDA